MGSNRRYYYLKLKENFFNSETIVVLESIQDGILYSNLLLKMYLMSLKNNGILMLNDRVPHTPQTIATYARHQIGTVERALQIFIQLGLMEVLSNGAYYMSDIQLLIGQSSTEGERKRRERLRLQQRKLLPVIEGDICPLISESETDTEKDPETERERHPSPAYGRYGNVFLSPAELDELQRELPDKWLYYIDRLSGYIASTGKRYQSHAATIRRWADEDKAKTGLPEYSCKEGESL